MKEKPIMQEAFREKILTEKEYNKKYKHKYIDNGCDSFPEFMQFVIAQRRNPYEMTVFVTGNSKIIKDKDKLSERFDVLIKSVPDALEMMLQEEQVSGAWAM